LEPDAHAPRRGVGLPPARAIEPNHLNGGRPAVGPPGAIAGADPDGSAGQLLHVLHLRVPLQLAAVVEDVLRCSADHGLDAVRQGAHICHLHPCSSVGARIADRQGRRSPVSTPARPGAAPRGWERLTTERRTADGHRGCSGARRTHGRGEDLHPARGAADLRGDALGRGATRAVLAGTAPRRPSDATGS
jgi:hypothetical protein